MNVCSVGTNLAVCKGVTIEPMRKLGELVRDWRVASGLTMTQLAQRCSTPGNRVYQQSISQFEAGEVSQPRYLPQLAKVMRCTVDDLLQGRIPPPLRAARPTGKLASSQEMRAELARITAEAALEAALDLAYEVLPALTRARTPEEMEEIKNTIKQAIVDALAPPDANPHPHPKGDGAGRTTAPLAKSR